MLYCNECKNAFGEGELRLENTGLYHAGVWEKEAVCPHCGSGEYEDASFCGFCGKFVRADDMHHGIDEICNGCYDSASKSVATMIEAHGSAAEYAVMQYMQEAVREWNGI